MPASPTISIARPYPVFTASSASVNAAISSSRPTSGRSVTAFSTRRWTAPTANASTGLRLPFT